MNISYEKSTLSFFNSHIKKINKLWNSIIRLQELYLNELSNHNRYTKYYKDLENFYRKNPKQSKKRLYSSKKKLDKINKKLNDYKYNRDVQINKIKSLYYQVTQTNWSQRGSKKISKKTFKKSVKKIKSRKRLR